VTVVRTIPLKVHWQESTRNPEKGNPDGNGKPSEEAVPCFETESTYFHYYMLESLQMHA
jgi:hypothetical protein